MEGTPVYLWCLCPLALHTYHRRSFLQTRHLVQYRMSWCFLPPLPASDIAYCRQLPALSFSSHSILCTFAPSIGPQSQTHISCKSRAVTSFLLLTSHHVCSGFTSYLELASPATHLQDGISSGTNRCHLIPSLQPSMIPPSAKPLIRTNSPSANPNLRCIPQVSRQRLYLDASVKIM